MRPTDLGFRSPKEKTPDAYNPAITNHGKSLGFSTKSRHGSFPQSKRFQQYDIMAKRTGYRIGPGSYEQSCLEITKPKRGAPVYKPFHGGKDVGNNGYFYIGNHLVFDPAFVLKSRKNSLLSETSKVEYSTYNLRPSSAKPRETPKSYLSTPNNYKPRPASARPKLKSPYENNIMT
jgi:hypothetical protein